MLGRALALATLCAGCTPSPEERVSNLRSACLANSPAGTLKLLSPDYEDALGDREKLGDALAKLWVTHTVDKCDIRLIASRTDHRRLELDIGFRIDLHSNRPGPILSYRGETTLEYDRNARGGLRSGFFPTLRAWLRLSPRFAELYSGSNCLEAARGLVHANTHQATEPMLKACARAREAPSPLTHVFIEERADLVHLDHYVEGALPYRITTWWEGGRLWVRAFVQDRAPP